MAARAKASDFFQQRGRWWLHTIGKGGLEGNVPVSDELTREVARYRLFVGLPSAPSPTELNPATMTVTGRAGRHLTPTAIYLLVSLSACSSILKTNR
jgi:hypothetical protein